MSDAEAIWRGKTDEEVVDAARLLSDYSEEGERIIRGGNSGVGEWPTPLRRDGRPQLLKRWRE